MDDFPLLFFFDPFRFKRGLIVGCSLGVIVDSVDDVNVVGVPDVAGNIN